MKKTALFIAFILAFGIFANAQSHSRIAVHIPFDFYVQNKKMTAGEYLIESLSAHSNQSTLVFRDKNGKAKAVLTTDPVALKNDRKSFEITLIFNRYGSEYFLAQIRNPPEETAFSFRAHKSEKNLARAFPKPVQEKIKINVARK